MHETREVQLLMYYDTENVTIRSTSQETQQPTPIDQQTDRHKYPSIHPSKYYENI